VSPVNNEIQGGIKITLAFLYFIESSLQMVWTVSLSNFLDISQWSTRATLLLFHNTQHSYFMQ